jgi:hypothetical protein
MDSLDTNHFIELLNNDSPNIIWDFDNMDEIKYEINLCGSCKNRNINEKLKKIIINEEYKLSSSPYSKLKFTFINNFILISTYNISDNLKHSNRHLDKVLKHMRYILFDNNYNLILYVNKPLKKKIKDLCRTNNKYDFKNYKIEFNHIGKYITLFFYNNNWFYIYNDCVSELSIKNHSIFYELIETDLNNLDTKFSYEFIMIDSRLNTLIKSMQSNHLVLVNSSDINFKNITCFKKIKLSKQIYISSLEEFKFYIEELDYNNKSRLNFKGIILKNDYEEIY